MSKIDGGLRSLFRQNLPQFDWVSIESGSTGGGIPDSNYCAPPRTLIGQRAGNNGTEGWIEHKQTTGHTVPLRPEQVGWLMRRTRYGGRTFVAVRQRHPGGPRTPRRDALWLIPGVLARDARIGGLRALAALPAASGVRCWQGGPSAWDWGAVAEVLTS